MSEDRENTEGDARGSRRRWLVRIAVTLVLLAAAVIVAGLLQPPRYFAKVTMEVRVIDAVPARGNDSKLIAEQFDVMRGLEILFPVIERLDLGRVFATGTKPLSSADVYPPLSRSLKFRRVRISLSSRVKWLIEQRSLNIRTLLDRDTELVEIGVYSSDPQLAANIANTIAIVYQEKRLLEQEKAYKRWFAEIEEAPKKQRTIVEQLSAEMAKIRTNESILDPDSENEAASVTAPKGKDSAANYTEAKNRYLQARKLLESAQANLQAERMTIRCGGFGPMIWEKAEPPREPVRSWLPRFW